MKHTLEILVAILIVLLAYTNYQYIKRVEVLEKKIILIGQGVEIQNKINEKQKNFNNDQLYFNTYIYQTLIVNRGKPL